MGGRPLNPALDVMSVTAAIQELRGRGNPKPRFRLPTREEVQAMEQQLGIQFHPEYVELLLSASDIDCGPIEPATIVAPNSHTYLPKVVASARHYGVPEELFPFCEDNADFYCMTREGHVVLWSHNGWEPGSWPDLASWIRDAWLDYDV